MPSNTPQCAEQPPEQRIIRTKVSIMPRLGNIVLEQFINVEKILKMKKKKAGRGIFKACF